MLEHVRRRLGDHEVGGALHGAGQVVGRARQRQGRADRQRAHEVLGRGEETSLDQRHRHHAGGQAAQLRDARGQLRPQLGDRLDDRVARRRVALDLLGSEAHQHEPVLEAVVQVAGDPATLGLVALHESGHRLAHRRLCGGELRGQPRVVGLEGHQLRGRLHAGPVGHPRRVVGDHADHLARQRHLHESRAPPRPARARGARPPGANHTRSVGSSEGARQRSADVGARRRRRHLDRVDRTQPAHRVTPHSSYAGGALLEATNRDNPAATTRAHDSTLSPCAPRTVRRVCAAVRRQRPWFLRVSTDETGSRCHPRRMDSRYEHEATALDAPSAAPAHRGPGPSRRSLTRRGLLLGGGLAGDRGGRSRRQRANIASRSAVGDSHAGRQPRWAATRPTCPRPSGRCRSATGRRTSTRARSPGRP